MKRGIFVGSFNPPHNGHLSIAEELINKKILDHVTFVPVGNNYHKKDLISASHRLNMLNILIKEEKYLDVSDIEIRSNTQNYTYQTLDEMKKLNPSDDIYLIIGSDNLKLLDKWMKYEYILDNYKVIVIKRDNDNLDALVNNEIIKNYKNNIISFPLIHTCNLSSTMIRDLINRNEKVYDYLNKFVYNYIKKYNLYKE
jgi:nicotinate-nucleotide adenylyltransferase